MIDQTILGFLAAMSSGIVGLSVGMLVGRSKADLAWEMRDRYIRGELEHARRVIAQMKKGEQ